MTVVLYSECFVDNLVDVVTSCAHRQLIDLVLSIGAASGSQLKQEDPPNLSILISGGKETNQDSPSKGD